MPGWYVMLYEPVLEVYADSTRAEYFRGSCRFLGSGDWIPARSGLTICHV